MRNHLSVLSAGIAVLLSLWTSPAAAADVLRVGGTGGATALLAHLGKPFTRQTGITVEVIPSLGSSGGIAATADGVLDLAVSGRPLSAAEQGRGLVQAAALRTPYVLATSHGAPPALTEQEVVGAYAAEKASWPDGSPIRLVLRPRAESDNQVLASLFPGMAAALNQARQRSDLPIAATDQDNADAAERLRGSLIGTTYTQVVMEERNLRLIPIGGVAPSIEAFESGAYRHTKIFHVVHPQQSSPAAVRFVQFLRSDEGVRALREAGCFPGVE
ncbi:PstS family phosphate ABC transporter substrate-binding protein [Roseomonas sp. GCM10028921]